MSRELAVSRKDRIIAELEAAWAELERRGAVVRRLPLSSHPSLLGAKLEHEQARLRALDEGPMR